MTKRSFVQAELDQAEVDRITQFGWQMPSGNGKTILYV